MMLVFRPLLLVAASFLIVGGYGLDDSDIDATNLRGHRSLELVVDGETTTEKLNAKRVFHPNPRFVDANLEISLDAEQIKIPNKLKVIKGKAGPDGEAVITMVKSGSQKTVKCFYLCNYLGNGNLKFNGCTKDGEPTDLEVGDTVNVRSLNVHFTTAQASHEKVAELEVDVDCTPLRRVG